MALNRARVASDINVNLVTLDYLVPIEFFDNADPSTVLWAETIAISGGATTAQLQAAVIARGQQIRAGLTSQAGARTAVPSGTTVTVP
jgi:hypothetical protein